MLVSISMLPELKNFQKSISTSRKRAENELFALQSIEYLIEWSDGKEWKYLPDIERGLKFGIYLGKINFVSGADYIVIQKTALEGWTWYPYQDGGTYSQDSLDNCDVLV